MNTEIFIGAKEKIQEQIKLKFEEHLESFNRYPVEADSCEFQQMIEEISHCACEFYMRTLLNYTVKNGAYLLPEPENFLYAPYEDRVNFAEVTLRYIRSLYRIWYEYTLIGDKKAKDPAEFIYWSASTLIDALVDKFKDEFNENRVTSFLVRGGDNIEVTDHKTVQTVKQLIMEVKIGFNKKIEVWHNTGFVMPGYGNLQYRYFVDEKQVDIGFKADHPVPPLHFDPNETALPKLQEDVVAYFKSIKI